MRNVILKMYFFFPKTHRKIPRINSEKEKNFLMVKTWEISQNLWWKIATKLLMIEKRKKYIF